MTCLRSPSPPFIRSAGCPPAPTESRTIAKPAGSCIVLERARPARLEEEEEERRSTRMLEGKARVEDTDMPARMQAAATSAASRALDLFDVADCRAIAGHIKTEFDKRYGVGWQCVVGANFGCFFTHTSGTFIYFSLERLSFLLFKAAAAVDAT
uniref:Dynein light chain n=3 Tax=Setaria TaxID=4554 RepID=K3YWD5_SETIT